MKINNKRVKYNDYVDKKALATLELILEDKNYWMSSVQLAELSGRRHDNVMSDIKRDLIDKISSIHRDTRRDLLKFQEMSSERINNILDKYVYKITYYKDKYNRKNKMYLLNRHASLLCLARYNTLIQMTVNYLFLELYDKEIERIKKKAESYDKVINGSGTLSVGTVAKSLNIKDRNGNLIGRNKLFEILRNNKVLQSSKSNWNIPYQNYIKNGYFRTLLSKTVNGITIATTRITPKGFEFIENLCNILGYVYDGNLEDLRIFVSNDDYSDEQSDFYK